MSEIEVTIEKVRFFGRHGVFEHERRDGNEFELSLAVRYDPGEGPAADVLSDTVSYVSLYEIAKDEMAQPRQLLETVARAIVANAKERHPEITFAECKVTKLTPPISGIIGSASVTFRQNWP